MTCKIIDQNLYTKNFVITLRYIMLRHYVGGGGGSIGCHYYFFSLLQFTFFQSIYLINFKFSIHILLFSMVFYLIFLLFLPFFLHYYCYFYYDFVSLVSYVIIMIFLMLLRCFIIIELEHSGVFFSRVVFYNII